MTTAQLEEELGREVQGLEGVELLADKERPELNRGFGFATFYNFACAEAARRKYADGERTVGGRPVTVTWAEPRKADAVDTSAVRSVYVGGLPGSVTEEKLTELFKGYGEIEKVMLPYSKDDPSKYREYGFVHFKERAGALQAVARAEEDKPSLDGKELSVALAKPQPPEREPGARGPPRGYGAEPGGPRRGYGPPPPPPPRGPPPRGGYGPPRGRGYEDEWYGEEEDWYDGGGGGYGGGGYGGGYAAAMGAGAVMMPVQLPNGQVGYMVMPTGGGGGGPLRRGGGYGYGAPRGGGGYRSAPY
ncbi:LIF2 [Scenedesmus sp. PABB004]|nr:LIF2 [Scenedesmus sp. PABB004]